MRRLRRFLEKDGTEETRNWSDGRRRLRVGLSHVESALPLFFTRDVDGLEVDDGFRRRSLAQLAGWTDTLSIRRANRRQMDRRQSVGGADDQQDGNVSRNGKGYEEEIRSNSNREAGAKGGRDKHETRLGLTITKSRWRRGVAIRRRELIDGGHTTPRDATVDSLARPEVHVHSNGK